MLIKVVNTQLHRKIALLVLLISTVGGSALFWAGINGENPESVAVGNVDSVEMNDAEWTDVAENRADVPRESISAPDQIDQNANDEIATLSKNGRIEGKAVEYQSNRPVTLFSVSLFVDHDLARTNMPNVSAIFSDESGNFAVADLEHKKTDLLARAEGYLPLVIHDIDVGGETSVVELHFMEARQVSGRVVSKTSGKAIGDAYVSVLGQQGHLNLQRPIPFPLPGQSTRTSPEGTFSLDELPHEDVTLYIRAEGYAPEKFEANSFSAGVIEFLLAPGASVAGQLIGVDGSSPQTGSIRLIDGVGFHHNLTNDIGQFSYKNKPPGDYVLFATTPVGQSDRVAITLKEGEHITGLRVQIRPGIELTGNISGLMSGETIVGVSTTLPGHISVSAKTDAAGNYVLGGLPPGDLRIFAVTTSGRSSSKVIELNAESAAYLDFVFEGSATIYGRVLGGGSPATNIFIEMIPLIDGDPAASAITSSEGRYEIVGLANANYALRVSGKRHGEISMNGSIELDIDL